MSNAALNTGKPTAEEAVEQYALWIKRTALHLHSTMPWADVEELIQWGTLGLLEARERFDPSRGKPFAAFAARRIRGSMIDSLRREGNQARRVNRQPSTISENTVGHSPDYDDPMQILLKNNNQDVIARAITQLTERQQIILQLFFVDEHNNREIARALEVSEAYVSKTRRSALKRIAELITNENLQTGDNP